MSLTANFTRGCVFMEATVSTEREANNVINIVKECGGQVIVSRGVYLAVTFFKDTDADKFLMKINPYITETKNEHEKL